MHPNTAQALARSSIVRDEATLLQQSAILIAAAQQGPEGMPYVVTQLTSYHATDEGITRAEVGNNGYGFSVVRKGDGFSEFTDAAGRQFNGRHVITIVHTNEKRFCWIYTGPDCSLYAKEDFSVVNARLAEFIFRANQESLPMGERLALAFRYLLGL